MNYFEGCSTLEERKKRYRSLCKTYHPDICGDDNIMKIINSQYHKKIEVIPKSPQPEYSTTGAYYTFQFNSHDDSWQQRAYESWRQQDAKGQYDYMERMRADLQKETEELYEQRRAEDIRSYEARMNSSPFSHYKEPDPIEANEESRGWFKQFVDFIFLKGVL